MNFLVIVTDDQRLDGLNYMPHTRGWLQAAGGEFTQARCNQAICGSARAGLFTGLLSKDHEAVSHDQAVWTTWWDTYADNTIGKWLDDAGFRTGMIGKVNPAPVTDEVPLGWDTWKRVVAGGFVADSYAFDVWDGTTTTINEYQTEWMADQATTFMAGTEPWFLWLAPTHPHWVHAPHPDDFFAWSWVDWPIVDEADVSDKPAAISGLPALTDADRRQIRQNVRGHLRELTSLDRMVDTICTAVDFTDTMVFFTSDNGLFFGEHRHTNVNAKDAPYDPAMRVPLLARGPGFTAGQTDRPVTHVDITKTIVAASGATAGLTLAGVDLRDVQNNPAAYDDRALLHEVGGSYDADPSDGITTGPHHSTLAHRKLFRYPSVRVDPDGPYTYECYDLDTDPDEYSNWANEVGRSAERDALEAELDTLLA